LISAYLLCLFSGFCGATKFGSQLFGIASAPAGFGIAGELV